MFKAKVDLFHLYINHARNEPLTFKESLLMVRDVAISFIKDCVRFFSMRFSRRTKQKPLLKGKRVIFANSYNTYEALKFFSVKYPESVLVCAGGYVSKLPNAVNIRKHLTSYGEFGKYLFLLFLSVQPRYRLRHYGLILKEYRFEEQYLSLLSGNEPECIFIANDHYPSSRGLILAARKMHIPCIYIQHASVTKVFPALRSSHALLYGKYSEDIYKNIKGSEGVIVNVGNHRFDSYKASIKDKKFSGRIGVAFNTLDPIDKVLELCEILSASFGKDAIILRAHPAEKRTFKSSFEISPSKVESSLDFLKNIDVLIAGNSSILLEAAAMNVYPFQYYFDGNVPDYFVDYYGFIKTGVATEAKSQNELVVKIQEALARGHFESRHRTKLYDASIDEPYEFHVEDHIISVVNQILSEQGKR